MPPQSEQSSFVPIERPRHITLDYLNATAQLRPTRHAECAIASWLLFIAGVAFTAGLIALAYHRSYTYPFERFDRNVGPRWVFVQVLWWNALIGALLANAGLLQPYRRRWIAWPVVVCHMWMMAEYGWRDRSETWLLGVLCLTMGAAIIRIVARPRSRES